MLVVKRSALPALLVLGLASIAGAQQKACDIDEGSPNQVARAVLDIQIAQNSAKPEEAVGKLKDAVKILNEGDMKKNPTGRASVYGKTMVLWMSQPGVTNGIAKRGLMGFTTDTAGTYDLVAGMDSAFTVVETANPECVATYAPWRQQKAWVETVNGALQAMNADKTDSAIALAKRSIQMYRGSPYGYWVLAQAAAKNNQTKEAIGYYKQAIGVATDTAQSIADLRRNLQVNLGNFAVNAAATAPAADKSELLAEAKSAFDALAKDPGTKYADAARTGLASIATATGDTAAIKASYSDQLANPSAFSYNSLMQAAVVAAKANQPKDAIKLFEAAHSVNAYHRDVLYNLARLYLLDSAWTPAISYARQLVSVDPDNPDSYQLLMFGYGALQKAYGAKEKDLEAKARAYGQRANTSKSSAVIKAAVDSAARLNNPIKAYGDSTKMYVDSALKYNGLITSLPAKVTFSEFTPGDAKTTLSGTLTNQTDASRSFAIKLEFLDKTGNVVATQDVSVGPVAPHQTSNFTATAPAPGVTAFRYAPIT
ncbi:MAG: tetratricopeptide repeat protein [Gemmatimonadales bacterium]